MVPSFLSEDEHSVTLATAFRFKRAIEAVRGGREYATPATEEYFATLAAQFECLRISADSDTFDDVVVQSVDGFLPYRNEAIEMFLALALYLDAPETRRLLHRFFEQLIPSMERPEYITGFQEWDFDNYKFIIHELFLYALAAFLRHERFESAAYLLANQYYVPGRSVYGHDVAVDFDVMRQYMKSLEYRNTRLKLQRLSVRADMLKDRCKGVGVEFRHLMQADFVAFLRSELDHLAEYPRWWPETLVWLGHHSTTMEIFARSRSLAYFDESRILLGIQSKDEMIPLMDSYAKGERKLPRWEFESFSPRALPGFDELATRP